MDDLVGRALRVLRNAGAELSVHGDVILCVLPQNAGTTFFSLQVLEQRAGEVRQYLRREAEQVDDYLLALERQLRGV
jgi:hypothetical protein